MTSQRASQNARIEKLAVNVLALKKEIGLQVQERMNELRAQSNWFSELCFCITTANYSAQGGLKIQQAVPDFSAYDENEIEARLRQLGHRFPRVRAKFLSEAKKHKKELPKLKGMQDSAQRREWLVKNVKGLGYKEASHFLRNVGFFDLAIIDKHILKLLTENKIIEKPRSLTPKKYLEIEVILREVARKTRMSLGELDFYLWYMKTGKVLK